MAGCLTGTEGAHRAGHPAAVPRLSFSAASSGVALISARAGFPCCVGLCRDDGTLRERCFGPWRRISARFADQELADDTHSGFVLHTYELASIEVVGEGIRAACG